LQEYSGLYMHCGGSPEALVQIEEEKVFDANEMYSGGYFWRDYNKTAPHNLFTSSERWNKLLVVRNEDKVEFDNGWHFGDLMTANNELIKSISIEYGPDNIVVWKYNMQNNFFERYQNDVAQTEGDQMIYADSVVVQYVKTRVLDDYGRLAITTSGEGDLRLLRDGVMIRGTWKNENGRTRFFDTAGLELNLKAGKLWIQIVPKDTNIKIST